MSQPTSPQPSLPSGLRTWRGSCHCGAVRYEADLDLGAGSTRCNCTFCTKTGWWGAPVKPGAFRLLSGQEQLRDFRPNPYVFPTYCKECGVRAFGHGNLPELGGEYYQVNLRCLEDAPLDGMPVTYLDGRHDTWAPLGTGTYMSPFAGAPAI